jgi:hypothetical protein
MQTFLPLPDFIESAKVLDYKRLGKQRVEAWQILKAILNPNPILLLIKAPGKNNVSTRRVKMSQEEMGKAGTMIIGLWIIIGIVVIYYGGC